MCDWPSGCGAVFAVEGLSPMAGDVAVVSLNAANDKLRELVNICSKLGLRRALSSNPPKTHLCSEW